MGIPNKNNLNWNADSLPALGVPCASLDEGTWSRGRWLFGSDAANLSAATVARNAAYALMGRYMRRMVYCKERISKCNLLGLACEMRTVFSAMIALALASVAAVSSSVAHASDDLLAPADACEANYPVGDQPDLLDATTLVEAAIRRDWDTFYQLVNDGAKPDVRGKRGVTALHVAVALGNQDAVNCLIDKGAILSPLDNNGYTPLHFAARTGNTEIAKILVSNMIKTTDSQNNTIQGIQAMDKFGATPLHYAAWADDADVISYLHENGANVNAKDFTGETPLHYAAINDADNAINKLLDIGADVMAMDSFGETPLHEAAWAAAGRAVDILYAKNHATIKAMDEEGDTPCIYSGPIQKVCP